MNLFRNGSGWTRAAVATGVVTVVLAGSMQSAWAASPPAAGTITTFAGTGQTSGAIGDGGPAANAVLDTPSGIAVDAAGDTYISEYWSSRVRKITPQGVISTFAGTGVYGSGPDGGQASATQLKTPTGLAVDGQGNVYIADNLNSRISKVAPSGIISTVAGNGSYGYSGDGGPAGAAALNQPTGLAVDSTGNLYVADTNNNRIRKIDTTGIITTVLGTGVAGSADDQLAHPHGVAVNKLGDLYVADTNNNRVQELTTYQTIWTAAGGQSGPLHLNNPYGVAVSPAGSVYVADTGDNRIVGFSAWGKIRPLVGTTVAGFAGDGGQGSSAEVNAPQAIAVDAANTLSIADTENNRVRQMVPTPLMTWVPTGGVRQPYGVAVDQAGDVYVSDSQRGVVVKVTPSGATTTVAVSGHVDELTVDRQGDIYFADGNSHVVRRVDPQGNTTIVAGTDGKSGFGGDGGPATQALLSDSADQLAVDSAGDLFIADNGNDRIREVTPNGVITTFAGTGSAGYTGDGGPATSAMIGGGYGSSVATDAAGDVYYGDGANHRIRKIDSRGVISTVIGSGSLYDATKTPFAYYDGAVATSADLDDPATIAVDPSGNVYFFDLNTINKVGADGIVHVIAGTGSYAGETGTGIECDGDGGVAKLAEFATITQLAVDSAGNTYAADPNESCRTVHRIAAG